jgi:hypothetical protein
MPNLPCAAATRVARKKKGYGQQCNDCGVMRHGDILGRLEIAARLLRLCQSRSALRERREKLPPIPGLVENRPHLITTLAIAIEPPMLQLHPCPGSPVRDEAHLTSAERCDAAKQSPTHLILRSLTGSLDRSRLN